jgi:hypothetical protein
VSEPFRVTQPRWQRRPDGSQSIELAIEWGDLPTAWKKEVKRNALKLGRSLIDAYFELLDDEDKHEEENDVK